MYRRQYKLEHHHPLHLPVPISTYAISDDATMPEKHILLQGGTVLTHSPNEQVVPLHDTDVLISGNIIADVGKDISPPSEDTDILDCHGKIVSPGFVDTHHHLWQTQLKGRHANEGLVSYMVSGMWPAHAR